MKSRYAPPESISTVLQKHLKKHQLFQKIHEYSIFDKWDQLVGTILAQHSAAKRIHNNILYVQASHATWLMELKMLEPKILAKLKQTDPKSKIEKIKFYL